ncbi:unnamed protein product [Rangifer tarandus platyrhynchus]|uniref:Uncharacterized protein n=2 Tax=Rangifer tarandus platyrhynchus TaxID=3082113 RepID=A0AC59ZIQ7_RANTA|nr:unnamed protein product [Rangifer tarandus platyrhynchus]
MEGCDPCSGVGSLRGSSPQIQQELPMGSALGVPTPYALSPKAHTQQGPCPSACQQLPGMSWGYRRPVHPSIPTFPLPPPPPRPTGALKAPPFPLTLSQLLDQEGHCNTSKEGELQWTPLMSWTLPPQSLASLDLQPAQPLVCPALASFQGPTSPRRTASRPLGMLEPPKFGGVLCGVGEDTSCLIHQPPPRLPLLSAVGGGRVSPRVCFSLR